MRTDSIESVRLLLRKCSLSERRTISRETGIPLQTLRNFALGITANPRYDTFAPLQDYFTRQVRSARR